MSEENIRESGEVKNASSQSTVNSDSHADRDDLVSVVVAEDPLTQEWVWKTAPRRTKGFTLLDFVLWSYLDECGRRGGEVDLLKFGSRQGIPPEMVHWSMRRLYEGGLVTPEVGGASARFGEFNGEYLRHYDADCWIPKAVALGEVGTNRHMISSVLKSERDPSWYAR